MVTVKFLRSVWNFKDIEVNKKLPGLKILDYAPDGFSLDYGRVNVNGVRLERDDEFEQTAKEGDVIVFMVVPGGTEFGIALAVSLIISAITAGISYALRPKPPKLRRRGSENEDVNPQPEFSGVQTTVGPGKVIPWLAGGPIRIGGHAIESFTDVKFDTQPDSTTTVTAVQQIATSIPGTQSLQTRIAWGWGPFESIEQFEIDDNPIANIKGISYETKNGTKDQSAPFGFRDGAKNERSINQAITQAGGQHIEATVSKVNYAIVKLRFANGLFTIGAENQLQSRTVQVQFEYRKTGGGGFTTFKTVNITRATQGPFSFFVRFPDFTEATRWDIAVTRITADTSGDLTKQDAFTWERLTEVRNGGRVHPGIANTGFSQIPQEQTATPLKYTALARGVNNVRIYNGPNEADYYTGWTDDAGMLFLHWLTNPIYGRGRWYSYKDNVDFQSFVDLFQRNQELVSDGKGGLEKRCKFAFYFNSPLSPAAIVEIFEKAAEANFVEEGGVWRAIPLEAEPASNNFTEGRYEPKSFLFRHVNPEDRPKRIIAQYQDEERNFDNATKSETHSSVNPGESIKTERVNYWGVTRKSEISRKINMGLAFAAEAYDEVSLTTNTSALGLRVGDTVNLSSRAGNLGIASGRLARVHYDHLRLELDEEVSLTQGTNYEITLIHASDPSKSKTLPLVNVITETTNWVEVASALWEMEPKEGDFYSVGLQNTLTQKYRVRERTITKDWKMKYRLLRDADSIYSVETQIDLDTGGGSIPNPDVFPGKVIDLTAKARKPQNSVGDTRHAIDVSWEADTTSGVLSTFEIYYKLQGTNHWHPGPITAGSSETINNNLNASTTYDVAVVSVSPTGKKLNVEESAKTTVTTQA